MVPRFKTARVETFSTKTRSFSMARVKKPQLQSKKERRMETILLESKALSHKARSPALLQRLGGRPRGEVSKSTQGPATPIATILAK